jgi:hypothetical protein
MNEFYKIQNYGFIPLSVDIKKSAYVFLSVFLHLMAGFIKGNKHIPKVFVTIEKTDT